ncbi:MAG: hypothetical protein ACUVRX_03610 [Actinomycetota bacterium]
MVLRLVSGAKGVEVIEEKVAEIVFEMGRGILQAVYTPLDSKA